MLDVDDMGFDDHEGGEEVECSPSMGFIARNISHLKELEGEREIRTEYNIPVTSLETVNQLSTRLRTPIHRMDADQVEQLTQWVSDSSWVWSIGKVEPVRALAEHM